MWMSSHECREAGDSSRRELSGVWSGGDVLKGGWQLLKDAEGAS